MIGFLQGRIVECGDDGVVINVGGVGYELQCSSTTLASLPNEAATDVEIWVQTFLREDEISLFGFATKLEKRMFQSLLKVNGVGPKMAIKILSAAPPDRVAAMIEAGDVRALSGLPKVGKKTAEQLVLSLKGHLSFLDAGMLAAGAASTGSSASKAPAGASVAGRFSGTRADVLSALINLGFRLPDVERVVAMLPEEIEIQQGVRRGLQALSGGI